MKDEVTAKRKQIEQALHENQGLFRHLVESAHAIPWEVDLDTWRFTYVGPQAVKLLGHPLEAWYEENFWIEHLHPDDREASIKFCQEATARGEDHEFEYRMLAADGSVVWIRDSATVVTNEHGPIALRGYMFDITAYKQAFQALTHSKSQFEAMFNAIPDAVMLADTERRIVMNNPAVLKMFGYSDEELIGNTTEMLYADPADFKNQGQHRYRVSPGTEQTPYEVMYKRKDGTVFWTETLGTQVKDTNGTIIGFIGMFRDITERKQAEAVLEDKDARIRRIFESALDAAIIINEKSVINEWNPQAEVIFGWEKSEVIGQTLMETIIPPHYREAHQRGMETLMATGEGPILNRRMELTAMHREGNEFPIELTISPLRYGETWIFSAFVRDLTERKQAEKALHESEKYNRMLFEQSTMGLALCSMNGELVDINPAYAQIINRTVEETLKLTYWDITPKSYAADERRQLQNLEKTGRYGPYEKEYIHKDGHLVPVRMQGLLLERDGKQMIWSSVEDISERKQAERQIETHVNRLQKLSELSMALTGDPADVFEKVARMIGELLDVRVVCLSEIRGEELYFISVYVDGEVMADAGHCPLDITPCATVEQSKDFRIYDQVADRFPEASFLKTHNAYSYCGFPALSSDGKVVAVTCLLDDKPHDFSQEDQDLLRIFGQRIGLEIERKHREDKLQQSEASFKALAEESPNMIFINTRGRVVFANKACADQTGYNREEFYAEDFDFMRLTAPESKELIKANFQRHLQGENIPPYEFKILTKDKRELTVIHGTRIIEFKGQTSILGIITDITESKKSEEALRESENRFRQAFENAALGISIVGLKGQFIQVNHYLCQLLGYSETELLSMSFSDVTHPDDLQIGVDKIRQMVSGEIKSAWFEKRYIHKLGQTVWAMLSTSLLHDKHGEPLCFVTQTQDITKRKQSEEALHKSEHAYRTLAENLPGVVYRLYLEGKHYRLQFFNKMAKELTGYTDKKLNSGKVCSFEQLIVDQDRPMVVAELKRAVAQNRPFTIRYQIRHKDGSHRYILEQGTPINDTDGKLLYIDGVMFDVTEHKQAEEKVRVSEKELSAILDSLQDVYYRADSEGRLTRVSPSVQKLLGYTPQQLLGTSLADLYVDPQGREKFLQQLEKHDGVIENYEAQFRHKDGSHVWVSTNAHTIRDELGNPIGIEGTTRDISQIKAAEDLRNRFGRILDNSSNEIYIFDAESMRFSLVNRGARHNLGYSMQEMEQLTPLDLKPDFTAANFTELVQPLREGKQEQVVFQTRHLRKDGSLYSVEVNLQLSHEESPPVFVAIIQDITERMQTEEQLQYLAHHDALTTLPNRVLFTDRLEQSLARTHWHDRAVAVLFLDLDRFKVINDTLGHDVGDRALQALSERLNACVREGDTVARLGGDEFAIVLEDIATADDVAPTARKILDVLSQPFQLDGHEFVLTTSIGISLCPIDGKDTQTLLKHADIAMYRAKEQGRNTYQFYSEDMSVKAFERLNLETNLRHALEREEFALYYQPQQDFMNGRVVGVEALLRWQHPDLGLIGPIEFIPLLEETGMIVPVGEWALQTACLQARAWNDDDSLKPLRMSVNLSGRQVSDANFIATVKRILADSKLKPALLELEITESILLHNVQTTIEALETLSNMGIRLAIDDFGTGYSSLSYLKRFPIDTLKIDRSFIHDLTQDPDDATLVEAIIAMGRTLHLNVVAEGVETQAQADFLRAHNCDGFQGYLLSQPLPAAELTALMHKQNEVAGKLN